MTPAEEDALTKSIHGKLFAEALSVEHAIRLAIRAAVAQERERAARVCEITAWQHESANLLGPEQNAMKCAAAIRKGEK